MHAVFSPLCWSFAHDVHGAQLTQARRQMKCGITEPIIVLNRLLMTFILSCGHFARHNLRVQISRRKKEHAFLLLISCWKSSITFTANLLHYSNNWLLCWWLWLMAVWGVGVGGGLLLREWSIKVQVNWCVILLFSSKFHVAGAWQTSCQLSQGLHVKEVQGSSSRWAGHYLEDKAAITGLCAQQSCHLHDKFTFKDLLRIKNVD